jgi:damage-control phosphatase, subfamily I
MMRYNPPMRTYYDCYPCLIRQSLEASRMAGAQDDQVKTILNQAMSILQEMPDGATPPEIGTQIHSLVRRVTGVEDPYQRVKQLATDQALDMVPKLKNLIVTSDDPLDTALRLSIAGNIIDFGPNPSYDLWVVVKRLLNEDFAIDDTLSLWAELSKAETILFLGDNAGETVFDRLLIEALNKPITFVVRGGPTLNDATKEDAIAAGINQVAEIIDNGTRIPGTVLSECSKAFLERFWSADMILAKGMGNYETLSEVKAPIYFLMQVKCPIIGKDVDAPAGSAVVMQGLAAKKK